jgi:hypothetical protein
MLVGFTTYKRHVNKKSKSKIIPVTGLGGLSGCEMLRIPCCLDNLLTDAGKVAALHTRRTLLSRNTVILMFLVLISLRD